MSYMSYLSSNPMSYNPMAYMSTVALEMKLWTQQLEMQGATEYVRTDLGHWGKVS